MPQPYNYTLNVPSPSEAFMQGAQIGLQKRQLQMQIDEAQAAADKAQKLNHVFTNILKPGATEADRRRAVEMIPEYAAQINKEYEISSDAQKRFSSDTLKNAWVALTGTPDGSYDVNALNKVLTQRADAAESAGYSGDAAAIRDIMRQVEVSSPESIAGHIEFLLLNTDPDAHSALIGNRELRNLLRTSGIPPNSPDARDLLQRIAINKGDLMLMNTPTPDGTLFTGPLRVFESIYGNVGNIPRQSQPPPSRGRGEDRPPPEAPSVQVLPLSARPEGLTDDQLREQAFEQMRRGGDPDFIWAQLNEWGVN